MEDIAVSALRYITLFKQDATARIDADLSRAIGRTDWDEYTRLQKVKLRIKRLEMHAAAESRLGRFMKLTGIVRGKQPAEPKYEGMPARGF